MALVVNGRPLAAEARFQSQANACVICGEKVALRERESFKRVYSVIPPALHSNSSIHLTPRFIISAIDSVFKQHTKLLK